MDTFFTNNVTRTCILCVRVCVCVCARVCVCVCGRDPFTKYWKESSTLIAKPKCLIN